MHMREGGPGGATTAACHTLTQRGAVDRVLSSNCGELQWTLPKRNKRRSTISAISSLAFAFVSLNYCQVRHAHMRHATRARTAKKVESRTHVLRRIHAFMHAYVLLMFVTCVLHSRRRRCRRVQQCLACILLEYIICYPAANWRLCLCCGMCADVINQSGTTQRRSSRITS